MVPLAVTVSARHAGRFGPLARQKAAAWGLPFIERCGAGSLELMLERDARALLVLAGDGWALRDAHGSMRFSPGMARLRIKRLQTGVQQDDVVVRLCELRPGDSVFDGTLGLAGDAQVCAHTVGPTGRVVGVEGSLPLYALVSEGLCAMGSGIGVEYGRTLEVLRRCAPSSFDCVLLDPMFDRPRKSSPAFDILRRFAVHEPITADTLEQARRVARRWVVVKAARDGQTLRKLGLTPLPGKSTADVAWARF
jgi:16S rRNA (guanine1516-N2)-methyltransferase